jgi:hypothetical protein
MLLFLQLEEGEGEGEGDWALSLPSFLPFK